MSQQKYLIKILCIHSGQLNSTDDYTTIVVSVNDERGSIFDNNFPMVILKKFFWILIVLIISEFWA